MSLSFKTSKYKDNIILVELEGKIISDENFAAISDSIDSYLKQGKRRFNVHLNQVNTINSSGLNLLLRLFTKVRNKGGELVITAPSKSVAKLLDISKLNSIFTICADNDEAQNILNAQEA